MKRARLAVVGVCLLGLVAEGFAEEIRISTLDGRTYEGRLVSETDAGYVVEVRRGALVAEVSVSKQEVSVAQRLGPDPAALALRGQVEAAREVEGDAERGQALLALAHEQELRGDPREAARLYREAGESDPGLRDQTETAAARSWILAGEEVKAERVLRAALERNPKNAHGMALSRQLAAKFAEKARTLVEPGIREYVADHPRRALQLLVRAAEELPHHVLDAASVDVEEELGLSIVQVMVDCRLRQACSACDGDGVRECPSAASNAATRCRFGRRTTKLRTDSLGGGARAARWSWCRDCNGLGHTKCEDCLGLGLSLSRPTSYEREELSSTLAETLGGLEQRAGSLLERVDEGDKSQAVRSVAATELLGVLQGIRGYSKALSGVDPRAGAPGGGNLRRKGRDASHRAAAIMTALANALYVAGEQRFEDAVGTFASPFAKDAKYLTPAGRSLRARQAWEIVNQARAFTLEALELNPATAGPTAGDMRRRLSLMDRFLKRTWKTYARLSLAERNAEGGSDVVDRILREAIGAGVGAR